MPRWRKQGFTVYVQHRTGKLALQRQLPDLATAMSFVERIAAVRPTGRGGIWITNEETGELYAVDGSPVTDGSGPLRPPVSVRSAVITPEPRAAASCEETPPPTPTAVSDPSRTENEST
ncbi:MAG TPA: hypothetical protein VHB21_21545 [Minicystis sp.]|nr:hypothetical protein [Minicystis sp.]